MRVAVHVDITTTDCTDFVLQLRRQVRPDSPQFDNQEHGQYIDLVGYWKERCRTLLDECETLRKENAKLERSNHLLTNRASCTRDTSPVNAMNTSKRKARAASPARNLKRPKGVQQVEHSVAETQEGIDNDFDFLDSLGQGKLPLHLGPIYELTRGDRGSQSY